MRAARACKMFQLAEETQNEQLRSCKIGREMKTVFMFHTRIPKIEFMHALVQLP